MNATPSQEPAGTPFAAGIEIAESATRITLTFGATSQARRWHTRLASPPTPAQMVDTIVALLDRALADVNADHVSQSAGTAPRLALGVALADATVDARHGIVRQLRFAPGWEDVPLAAELTERTSAPVQVATATNAAAFAETHLGAGIGMDPLLYVSLARTITCAIVVGGRYLTGAHAAEGQLGHWLARPDGPRCACGAYGHLDPIASAQSLVRNLIGRAADSDESTAVLLRASGGRAEAISAAQVVGLAQEGDPAARGVLDEALDALAGALADLVAVLDPAAIVIGGPLAAAGDGFFSPLASRLRAHCTFLAQVPDPRPATLGPMAAILGARMLAIQADAGQ